MVSVALELLVYAIQLTIRFGKQNRDMMHPVNLKEAEPEVLAKCRKIDLYALRTFVVLHAVVVGAYVALVTSQRGVIQESPVNTLSWI